MRLYTLGIGQRPGYEFSRLLIKFGIQVLFDLRDNPPASPVNLPVIYRREETDYSRSALEELCSANKVDYVYLGNELSAPLRNNHKEWLEREAVKKGIKIIASKVPMRVCCLVCACYYPDRCHRRLIAEELAKQGIEVVHILEENRFWSPVEQFKPKQKGKADHNQRWRKKW